MRDGFIGGRGEGMGGMGGWEWEWGVREERVG